MGSAEILHLVSRLENLADALYGRSLAEINSLMGQANGTIHSINDELRRCGLDPRIPELAELGWQEFGTDNVEELARIYHHAAARFRDKAARV